MKPTKTGVFTFALILPMEMKVGDLLIWRCSQSVSNASVTHFLASASEENEAIFIDNATKKETKVVPASRNVSVSTYLKADYVYEPVIMTASGSPSPSSGNKSDNKTNADTTSEGKFRNDYPEDNYEDHNTEKGSGAGGGGGGGCVTGLHGILWLSLAFVAKKKLSR